MIHVSSIKPGPESKEGGGSGSFIFGVDFEYLVYCNSVHMCMCTYTHAKFSPLYHKVDDN